MDDLIQILFLIYKSVSSREILEGDISYIHFPEHIFCRIANVNMEHYSRDDVQNLYHYLISEIDRWKRRNNAGGRETAGKDGFCILDPLRIFTEQVLCQVQELPVCQYRNFLNWRLASFQLDEDLFTTFYLSQCDAKERQGKRNFFGWKDIISHDNIILQNILNKGMVENHFHLKGSAPYFRMSWINLMNLVNNVAFSRILRKYDKDPLYVGKNGSNMKGEASYELMHLQAAVIRLFLFSVLKKEEFSVFGSYRVKISSYWDSFRNLGIGREKRIRVLDVIESVENYCKENLITRLKPGEFLAALRREEKIQPSEGFCLLAGLLPEGFLFESGLFRDLLGSGNPEKRVSEMELLECLLERVPVLLMDRNAIGRVIRPDKVEGLLRELNYEKLKEVLLDAEQLRLLKSSMQSEIDMVLGKRSGGKGTRDYMEALARENGAVDIEGWGERYFMYTMFYRLYTGEMSAYGNLFYTYLIIKEHIRSELVQSNNRVGFHNFLRYQDRKEAFIDNTPFEKVYTGTAVRQTLGSQRVLKLEARISPKDTVEENCRNIKKLDRSINNPKMAERVFYVFHFVKGPDGAEGMSPYIYRHYKKRKKIEKQAAAIAALRSDSRYAKQARRVYGIDACSMEIGCRPEVFGQAYRFLRSRQAKTGGMGSAPLPRLGATYHVGEDFLDIADGLRAIDEAIYFLNLSRGDRLGHALALGIPPREWYAYKKNSVFISRQDNLDNIVWLYQKIRKFNIRHSENILLTLQRSFDHCFHEIYSETRQDRRDFTIDVYYDAWKLRGDNPELYETGEYKPIHNPARPWENCHENTQHYELDRIRQDERCTRLYYMYHFNENVKRKGSERVEYKISPDIIGIVEEVQKHMQKSVMEIGLCIETNPSSNYQVGTFKRYDNHPILNFYNYGLVLDHELLEACPQIPVTINTDDQAIFTTTLENEFGYMAIALEKACDKNGNPLYKQSMVYSWLNNIRKYGGEWCFNQQRNGGDFLEEEEDEENL